MSQNEIVDGQHAQIGNRSVSRPDYERTSHPDAQWFQGSLGLFIHWGISSVQGTGDLSWSMVLTPPPGRRQAFAKWGQASVQKSFTPNEYWRQSGSFKPDRWNPRKILSAARKAGMRYAVLTTKHHDGFTLWPSRHGGFGVQSFLPGADFVKDYAEACRETGMKLGFYYSPPDWRLERERRDFGSTIDGQGRSVKVGLDHEPIDPASLLPKDEAYLAKWHALVKGQLYELLSNYGKVDLLWFDGSSGEAVTLEELRRLQPGIVFNNRGLGYGDYETPECAYPSKRPSGWWEYCHIWNDGAWGYLRHETYKQTGWMLGEWAKARAWGGNFLVNVGPNHRGELPSAGYARLAELAKWRRKLGYALAGDVQPGLWPERCNAPATIKGSKSFLLLTLDWDEAEAVVKGSREPQSVRLLSMEGSSPLEWRMDSGDLRIPIGKSSRGVLLDIVEIDYGAS